MGPRWALIESVRPASAHSARAQRDDNARADEVEFEIEPPAVVFDLSCCGALVQAALAALFELEVLDRVGEIGALARKAGLAHELVKQPAGRADEGPALLVFLVARLFADECDRRARLAFAEHGPGGTGERRRRRGDEAVERCKSARFARQAKDPFAILNAQGWRSGLCLLQLTSCSGRRGCPGSPGCRRSFPARSCSSPRRRPPTGC